MNIFDALKSIEMRKAEYFKYKFPDLRYDQSKEIKTEEDFLRLVSRKTINPFLKWEKTDEYKYLVQLYLNTKIADDMEKIYQKVSETARTGDEKSIKLFITLSKEIQESAKFASNMFEKQEEEEIEEDDGLEL